MGGGSKLPQSALLARPELASILQYHILPGLYTGGEQGERRRMGGDRGMCCCEGDAAVGACAGAGLVDCVM